MFSKSKTLLASLSLAAVVALTGCANNTGTAQAPATSKTILMSYADMAYANYGDALKDAKALKMSIDMFASKPNARNFEMAKAAWLKSRESYGQTEIFRLSNGPIDAEEGWVADSYGSLEGQLNAWPLDENMIDYTVDADGKKTRGNIIDTKGKFNPGGEESSAVDVTNITVNAITELNENGGEANVATGYHAVEFLLWGQDQDYNSFVKDSITKGRLQAGARPLSDFTSDKFADRRLAYLKAAAAKIVTDLETVKGAWDMKASSNCSADATGCYRAALLGELKGADAAKNINDQEALKTIFAGMGVFIKSELANERIAVAVLTPSEEDEHSCFSDNTHRDIVTNYQGFKNVLMGTYNGQDFGAAAIDNLDAATKAKLVNMMGSIEDKIAMINAVAETSRHFDHQIYPNDPQAKVIVKLKNELRKLGDQMVAVASQNGITLTVGDVTDPEETKL